MAKGKVQMDKQRSTKHTYKTKDRVTRTSLKTRGELRCSGRVSSSCSTSGTRRVNLVINPVISREWGKDREVFATSGTYPKPEMDKMKKNPKEKHNTTRDGQHSAQANTNNTNNTDKTSALLQTT